MKTRPVCLSLAIVSIVTLLALLPGTALAQDPNLDGSALSNPTPSAPGTAPGMIGPEQPTGSGTIRSSTWIAATEFTGKFDTTPDLARESGIFYHSPGSTAVRGYYATLELEQGLLVDAMTCAYRDDSATYDAFFSLAKNTIDFDASTVVNTPLGSGASTGSGGIGFVSIAITPNVTIQNQVGNSFYQYNIQAGISNYVSFAGCMIYWTRQVSPAPASATFSDVPTTHPFFRFIQALYSSGITAGCSATEYCPDKALTRGEMAVFLAKGLGLNYPN